MRPGRRGAALVLTTAALLAGLTGCGSGGGGGNHTRQAGPASAPAATAERPASSAPGVGPDGSAEPSAEGTQAAAPKTVPKSRLTPATGTFTEPQKDYLVGKVPVGMDPAAVLEAGQTACERIATTEDEDRAAARRAVEDGEIAHARDAITYLCPAYRDLLD
ncbi:hypothetical protein [Streptomyces sp. NPDC049040]|uniref:hypothetical protein n=1 Tax=Streptomyces sp. NPDC049040 TaxID=3365593 RepID=UPI00371AAD90